MPQNVKDLCDKTIKIKIADELHIQIDAGNIVLHSQNCVKRSSELKEKA